MGIFDMFRQFFTPSKFYHCSNCGYKLLKEDAVVSGWDSQQSVSHIHCPKCGKIIKHAP